MIQETFERTIMVELNFLVKSQIAIEVWKVTLKPLLNGIAVAPNPLLRWDLPIIHLKITSKKKLFQNFSIFQEMLHFYLNSAILLITGKYFQNFDVQFHLTTIILKYSF